MVEAEQSKIGITASIDTISAKLNAGEKLWDDGFFSKRDEVKISDIRGRTQADKLFESMILSIENDPEQRKAKYIGNLFANLCFTTDIPVIQVNSFIKIASSLSYNDLCYLYTFRNAAIFEMPDLQNSDTGLPGIITKIEIFELMQRGCIINNESKPIPQYFTHLDIRKSVVQGFGFALYELMGLAKIPLLDAYEVVRPLDIKFKNGLQEKIDKIIENKNLDLSDERYDELLVLGAENINSLFAAIIKKEQEIKQKGKTQPYVY